MRHRPGMASKLCGPPFILPDLKRRLENADPAPNLTQAVLVDADLERLELLAVPLGRQAEGHDGPAHGKQGGHALRLRDDVVAADPVEPRELDQGKGEQPVHTKTRAADAVARIGDEP